MKTTDTFNTHPIDIKWRSCGSGEWTSSKLYSRTHGTCVEQYTWISVLLPVYIQLHQMHPISHEIFIQQIVLNKFSRVPVEVRREREKKTLYKNTKLMKNERLCRSIDFSIWNALRYWYQRVTAAAPSLPLTIKNHLLFLFLFLLLFVVDWNNILIC